jgi:hypothetical protein
MKIVRYYAKKPRHKDLHSYDRGRAEPGAALKAVFLYPDNTG